MKLEGKVAVVTGGSEGIGLAIAKKFREEGAQVAICARRQPLLDNAAGEIGNGTLAVQGDVTNLVDLDHLFAETREQLGKIDVLVANVGGGPQEYLADVTEDSFDTVSNANFKAAFFTVQRALDHLNDGASIILVTTIAHLGGQLEVPVYAAAKAAVRSLTRSFAVALVPRGIRVNALAPGVIDTGAFDKIGMPPDELHKFIDGVVSSVPMGRMGTPDEMANVALFLASGESSYMTGSELIAGGGLREI